MATSTGRDFIETLPTFTVNARRRKPKAGELFKVFKHEGKAVVCKWTTDNNGGDGGEWKVFGELPPQNLNQENCQQILASLTARENGAQSQPPRLVTDAEITAAFSDVTSFTVAFRHVERDSFTFTEEHMERLEKLDTVTQTLAAATKTNARPVFESIFVSQTEEETSGSLITICATFIDVLTISIENMTKVDKSQYSSKVMLKVAKVRLQFLQALLAVASNEAATKRLVELELKAIEATTTTAAHDDSRSADAETATSTADQPQRERLLTQSVINVLHAASAKFDFVAVQVATNLLRNWTVFPNEAFRLSLITTHRAMTACVRLFGHKDSNVAAVAVATVRHICGNPDGDTLQHLVRN